MVVDADADDVVLTPYFTGVPANFLLPSIEKAGIAPGELDQPKGNISFDDDDSMGSAWKDIWSAGKGVDSIHNVLPVAKLINQLKLDWLN